MNSKKIIARKRRSKNTRFKIQLNDLAKLSKKNIKPLANFEDGRLSLILAETAAKSLKTKKLEKIKF